MTEPETYYPKEENLGKPCMFWSLGGIAAACCYPKFELEGRTTCGGTIDDVCLRIKDGRPGSEFTEFLLEGTNTQIPDSSLLPPGEIT